MREIRLRILVLSGLLCSLALPTTAQNITLYPGVDTLSLWGTCTPAGFFWRVVAYTPQSHRIVIHAQYGDLLLGVPPAGIIARYDSAYFEVPNSLNQNQYQLWYTNRSTYHPEHCAIPFDSLVVAFPGPIDLTLLVLRDGSVVDSAVMRFISYQTGLAVQEGPIHQITASGLLQNYPNPFNSNSEIRYEISDFRIVNLSVYDLLGREVAVLVNERKAPGSYEVTFDGSGLASGVYFYRIHAGDPSTGSGRSFVQTRRLLLIK